MWVDILYLYTNSLPKLLTCVRWNSHDDVAQVTRESMFEGVKVSELGPK